MDKFTSSCEVVTNQSCDPHIKFLADSLKCDDHICFGLNSRTSIGKDIYCVLCS